MIRLVVISTLPEVVGKGLKCCDYVAIFITCSFYEVDTPHCIGKYMV
jgi:hypothetical protein